jgi:CheY-like chemotaxis protein
MSTNNPSVPEHIEKRTILVVDDNVWMQRILGKILLSYDLNPILCSNGYTAIESAIEQKPTLIFLDIVMPELSGHQTLKLLKTLTATQNIPVVMITVASDAENLSMAIKLGASGFIRKPFTRAVIYDKLCDILGRDNVFSADYAPLNLPNSTALLDTEGNTHKEQTHVIVYTELDGKPTVSSIPLEQESREPNPNVEQESKRNVNVPPYISTPPSKEHIERLYKTPSPEVVRDLVTRSVRK